jgi:hypothetical protein
MFAGEPVYALWVLLPRLGSGLARLGLRKEERLYQDFGEGWGDRSWHAHPELDPGGYAGRDALWGAGNLRASHQCRDPVHRGPVTNKQGASTVSASGFGHPLCGFGDEKGGGRGPSGILSGPNPQSPLALVLQCRARTLTAKRPLVCRSFLRSEPAGSSISRRGLWALEADPNPYDPSPA